MTAGCNLSRVSGAASAPGPALRLEKPDASAKCGQEGHAFRERRGPKPTRRQADRFGTEPDLSWDGPLLKSAYAAQVIAQAVPETDRPSAAQAYRRARLSGPLLYDETL